MRHCTSCALVALTVACGSAPASNYSLSIGQITTVRLERNAGTGMFWSAALPPGLRLANQTTCKTTSPGGPDCDIFEIEGVAKGRYKVIFNLGRFTGPPAKTSQLLFYVGESE